MDSHGSSKSSGYPSADQASDDDEVELIDVKLNDEDDEIQLVDVKITNWPGKDQDLLLITWFSGLHLDRSTCSL